MLAARARWSVLFCVLAAVGCERPDREETSELSRKLELPPATEGNFFERAWESQPLGDRFVIIPLSAWEDAVAHGDPAAMQASNDQRRRAAAAASVANDLWATGAFSEPSTEQHEFSADDILVVATDPEITSDGRVLTTNYFISGASVSGVSPWVARNVSIALQPNEAGGGGRCCGPAYAGLQLWPSIDELPSEDCVTGPTAMCWDGAVTIAAEPEGLGPGDLRTQAGMSPIAFKIFSSSGKEHHIEFLSPLGGIGSTSCTNTTFDCTTEQPLADPSFGWEAEVPRSGAACAPGATPVSGRHVPPRCAMAGVTMGIDPMDPTGGMNVFRPAGGAAPFAECDGRCPSCSEQASMWNTGVVPRQCWLVQTAGEDDVCGLNTTSLVEQFQAEIRDFEVSQTSDPCMDLSNPTDRCGSCRAVGGGLEQSGLEICSRCSESVASGSQTNCRRYPHQVGTPIDQVADLRTGAGRVSLAPGCDEHGDCCENGVCTSLAPDTRTAACTTPQCDQSASSPIRPSTAPRPGMAQMAEPLQDINAETMQSDESGDAAPDDPKDMTKATDAKNDGDPVNVVDGSFVLSQTDLSFPGPHRALSFSRYYSSQTTTRGALGSNWVHNWEVRVVPLSKANMPSWVDPYCAGTPMDTTCVMLVSGESSRLFYLDQAVGLYVPQAGSMATVKHTNTGWVVRQPDGHKLFFDHHGYLVADKDRFGSGFVLQWELTAAGKLYEAICPNPAFALVNGKWAARVGPSGVSAEQLGCVLLGGLTGHATMPEYSRRPSWMSSAEWRQVLEDNLKLTPSQLQDADLVAARTEIIESQKDTTGNYASGVPLKAGSHAMRLVSVTDDLGRQLTFTYGTSVSDKGLLKTVTGPRGAQVTFTYQSPGLQGALPEPEGLNEAFLTSAMRTDQPTVDPELIAAGGRGFEFEYAWSRPEQMPNDLWGADLAYRQFFKSLYNCGFQTRDQCGKLYAAGAMFADLGALVAAQHRRLYSQAADNITTVTVKDGAGGVSYIESETRYDSNVYDEHFDKVRAQRWGSAADPSLPAVQNHPTTPAFVWSTALPLATFDYQVAVPRSSGGLLTGDETDSFLPGTLAARYPLETTHGDAIQQTYAKGLLLPAQAPVGLPSGARLPMLAEDMPQLSLDGTVLPACGIAHLPELRTRLPGYQPSLDYFDRVLPTTELATPGVSWTQRLERSRVSCDTLALAQTYDVRHNDLASTWQKAMNGDYVFETMTGRRAHTAANANRICAWSKYIDRDGDVHYSGVNFQGRALVEAVRVMNGSQETWKIAETLFNADGNVLSQRRSTTGSAPWTASAGDTRYTYLEEPIPTGSLHTVRPFHWAKRGNVIHVFERPRGGVVQDEVEKQPGTWVSSAGRYTAYGYEPFFNEVTFVEAGSVSSQGVEQPTSQTQVTMDYQEFADATAPEFKAMLDEIQSWGAMLRRQPVTLSDGGVEYSGAYDWTFIRANQLFVDFLGADVNGDGTVGGSGGRPVRVERRGGTLPQLPVSEFSFFSWNANGQLASTLSPDKVLTSFSYYSLDQLARGQADWTPTGDVDPGHAGFLASVTRSRAEWPSTAGPARASCASLPPQYRFLLSSCGSDVGMSLAGLGLSPEAVSGVLSASAGSTTRFNYNALGHLSAVRGQSGTRTTSVTDTDGRVRRTDLFSWNSTTSHSYVLTEYDRYMRPYQVKRYAGTGASLGQTQRTFDNDNRTLTECQERDANGCSPGASPDQSTRQRWIYTREGLLYRHVDPEGLVTEYARDGRKWVTRQKLISPVQGEGERVTVISYDDDGNVQTRVHGSGGAVLAESMVWDGLGRQLSHTDTQQRRWLFGYSDRDLLVTRSHDSAAAPWNEVMQWDGLGRLFSVEQNGTVVAEYWRLKGGLPYATSGTGRAMSFVTYDELGRVAFAEDAAGNQSVSTEEGASPSSVHRVTQSTIRKLVASGQLTTGTVASLDALGLPSEVREVGGSLSRTTTVLERTASGFPKRVVGPDGSETRAEYDLLGQLKELREQRAFGGSKYDVSSYSYNARGQLDTIVDPAGYSTVQLYNGFGQPRFKTKPASRTIEAEWSYDELGRQVKHTVKGGVDLGYRYDAGNGRLRAVVQGDPADPKAPVLQDFEYDELGRWLRASHYNVAVAGLLSLKPADQEVRLMRTYDDASRRYTETTQVGQQSSRTVEVEWTLDLANTWLRNVTLPDGRTEVEGHDGDGRQTDLTRAGGGTTTFAWVDELLAETTSSKPGAPLKRTVTYDGLAQPIAWAFAHNPSGPNALTVDVRRDVAGRIGSSSLTFATQSGSVPSWRGYVYDAMGRLSVVRESDSVPASLPATHLAPAAMESAVESAGNVVTAARWAYSREEAVGSLLSVTRTDTPSPPRFETPANYQTPFGTATARLEGHQLAEYEVGTSGTRTVAHDDAGRLASDGTQDFGFDDFGTLAWVKAPGGDVKELYLYDATGRLAATLDANGQGEVLTYDGAQAVQARAWDGKVVWTAMWGPGVDRLVSVEKDGNEYFALDDGKGSVVGWLDGTRNDVVARAEFTPEGLGRYVDEVAGSTCEEVDGARCDKPLGLPFGFHTAYASKVTGLLYFRNRWYSPEANQWLSQDPLDAVDSFNLYAFNGFDSVNFVDPWGLAKNNATKQGRPPTDEEKKTCAEYGVSPRDCADIIEIEAPEQDEEAVDECRGVRCGAAGPGGGLLNLGDGIWVAKEGSRPKPQSPKAAAAPKPPLTSMKPADIAKEVSKMSDAELELVGSRIVAPLKMTPAVASALDKALHERFERSKDFPSETARQTWVDLHLLEGYQHDGHGGPGVNNRVNEQAYNTIGSYAAEELDANVKGMAVAGVIRGAGKFLKPKPIYLPSWKKISVDMEHILPRHLEGAGPLTKGRTVFPKWLGAKGVLRAIEEAYGNAQKVGIQGPRFKLNGQGGGFNIEMWLNTETNIIETAYPITP